MTKIPLLSVYDAQGKRIAIPAIKGENGETGNVQFATFVLDPILGHLWMNTPDDYAGAMFGINSNGHMEVRI